MNDMIIVISTLFVFVLGWFVVKQVDRTVADTQQLYSTELRSGSHRVHIAAESPMLLASAAPAMESCTDLDPFLEFFVSSGKSPGLLRDLRTHSADIVLLTEDTASALDTGFSYLKIPYLPGTVSENATGLSVEDRDENHVVYAVWSKDTPSPDRDRVLIALENAFFYPPAVGKKQIRRA